MPPRECGTELHARPDFLALSATFYLYHKFVINKNSGGGVLVISTLL